jgi:5-hydroxyisourate hydrolase-like protein (transthyretin family)
MPSKNNYANYGKNTNMALLNNRYLGARITFLIFALAFILLPHSLAHAASSGRIFGHLLDGTKNNTPVAGQSVTLQIAQGNNARDLTSVKTDAHGSFSFANLATDNTTNYALYTRYQGAQYYTNLISLSSKPVQQINLTIYEATASGAKIAIVQATIFLHQPDAQVGVLSFSEAIFFKNLGTYTYVGSLGASHGKPNAILFPLPTGARNVALSKGFDGYNAIQVDRGFATDAALPPGTTQFVFSFELPYTGSNYNFNYQVLYPTVQFSLLIPPDLNINSKTLTSAGLITADDHPYRLFQAKDLLANTQIQAQLQGLPMPQTPPTPLNQNNIWLIVAILLMLAILAVTLFLLRSARHHQFPPSRTQRNQTNRIQRDQHQPSKGGSIVPTADSSATGNATTNDNQQQALLQELLNLDKAFEAGKLKKSRYEQQRARTKARLRVLMSEENIKKTTSGKEVS